MAAKRSPVVAGDTAQAFTPTAQQTAFRAHAALCVRNAKVLAAGLDPSSAAADYSPSGLLVGEWIETAIHHLGKQAPTMRQWRAWEADPEFREWFLDLLPTMQQMTLTDTLAINALYHRSMAHAMAAGDMRATAIYGAQLRAKDEADPHAMMELRAHIEEAARTTKWRSPTKDEVERGRDPDAPKAAAASKRRAT